MQLATSLPWTKAVGDFDLSQRTHAHKPGQEPKTFGLEIQPSTNYAMPAALWKHHTTQLQKHSLFMITEQIYNLVRP